MLAVVLLAVIFIPGVGDNTGGATRWIQVTSSFKFQPSEFCKILLIVFFAGFAFFAAALLSDAVAVNDTTIATASPWQSNFFIFAQPIIGLLYNFMSIL